MNRSNRVFQSTGKRGIPLLLTLLFVLTNPVQSTPFSDWQIQHFGDTANPDAQWFSDPDMDGRYNGEEFVFGSDPNLPSISSNLLFLAPPDSRLSVSFVPAIDDGAVLRLRTSTDMNTWTPVATRPLNGGSWAVHLTGADVQVDAGTDQVTITLPLGEETLRFADLQLDMDGSVIADADANGVPDSMDSLVTGIPPWQDSDGDGLSDIFEILTGRDPDTDELSAERADQENFATELNVFTPAGLFHIR